MIRLVPRWLLLFLIPTAITKADTSNPNASEAIQKAIDSAEVGPWPPAADVPLAAGLYKLDRPIWLDRPGVRLVGHRGTRLQAQGAFPALIVGLKRVDRRWEADHAAPLEGPLLRFGSAQTKQEPDPRFVWDFRGDSALILKGTPFDLGPWKGPTIADSQLSGWDQVRQLRVQIALRINDPTWKRQAILTLGQGTPDPWRLYCHASGRLAFEATLSDGGQIRTDWKAPEGPELVLDLLADFDAGTLQVTQNGQAVPLGRSEGLKPGIRLRSPEGTECYVARGIPSYYDHGRFQLHSLRVSTDGQRLAELDPIPTGGGEGLWRWRGGEGESWGFGLLRPVEWSNNDTIDSPAIKDLTISCPDGWPYGSGVLLGLAYDFEADHCRFLSGARGLDQLRIDVSYVTRIHHGRFFGQRDACVNLDYGISTLEALTMNPRGARWAIRSRDNDMAIRDIFIDPGEGMSSAVRLAESRSASIERLMVDAEVPRTFPDHIVHASLGRFNGGATLLTIRGTIATQTNDTLVLLDDPWEGQTGSGIGPGFLRIENSFRTFVGKQTPALLRKTGDWSIEIQGPASPELPRTIEEKPAVSSSSPDGS